MSLFEEVLRQSVDRAQRAVLACVRCDTSKEIEILVLPPAGRAATTPAS